MGDIKSVKGDVDVLLEESRKTIRKMEQIETQNGHLWLSNSQNTILKQISKGTSEKNEKKFKNFVKDLYQYQLLLENSQNFNDLFEKCIDDNLFEAEMKNIIGISENPNSKSINSQVEPGVKIEILNKGTEFETTLATETFADGTIEIRETFPNGFQKRKERFKPPKTQKA